MATTKAKNRRRVHPAEKASKRRGMLRQVGRLLFRGILGLVVLVALGLAAKGTYRWALRSNAFALAHISYSGLHRAGADELSRLASLSAGQNLLTLDTAGIARAMATHPWVRHVDVSRRWPHNVAIAVEEYAPSALASLGDLYLVGRNGEPFKRVQAGDALNLPLITGLTREDYLADASEVARQLKGALDLADMYGQTGYGRAFPLSEVRIAEPGYTLVVGKSAQEIHLGKDGMPQKLARLERVAEVLEGRAVSAEVIHLENRVRPAWIAVKLSTPVSERNRGRTK